MTTTQRTFAVRRRRGIASVLAMLFLILLGILSLGFYASTTTSVQIAKNDQKRAKALRAAESGVQFMRYLLAHVSVSHASDGSIMMGELYTDLNAMLSSTMNLGSNSVGFANNTIKIPAETGATIPIDSSDNTGFSITITNVGGGASSIVCKVMGHTGTGNSTRDTGVQLTFTRQENNTSLFDHAVASRGRIRMQKGSLLGVTGISPNTIASITSAQAASGAMTMTGGSVGGSVGVLDYDYASISGGTVHGTSSVVTMVMNGWLAEVTPPEFPTIDTSVFAPYATTTYTGGSTLSNVVIPPNTNPSFTGNVSVNGIVYVKSPNTVTFLGDTKLAGFIVFENVGDPTVNKLNMSGNFSVANLPADSQYDPLRAITGVSIIAPTTAMRLTGSADSTFGGNVITGTFENDGSADIMFENGSLVAMQDSGSAVNFNGKTIRWKNTGKNNQPNAGVTYSNHFEPSGGTYLELN